MNDTVPETNSVICLAAWVAHVIDRAIEDIEPGEHVHIHNIEGIRGRGDQVGNNK